LIYLDSSALVKLAIAERESAGLLSWLAEQPNLVRVSSSVIRVEVPRAVWRAVSYDKRLLAAARDAGLPTASPA